MGARLPAAQQPRTWRPAVPGSQLSRSTSVCRSRLPLRSVVAVAISVPAVGLVLHRSPRARRLPLGHLKVQPWAATALASNAVPRRPSRFVGLSAASVTSLKKLHLHLRQHQKLLTVVLLSPVTLSRTRRLRRRRPRKAYLGCLRQTRLPRHTVCRGPPRTLSCPST